MFLSFNLIIGLCTLNAAGDSLSIKRPQLHYVLVRISKTHFLYVRIQPTDSKHRYSILLKTKFN